MPSSAAQTGVMDVLWWHTQQQARTLGRSGPLVVAENKQLVLCDRPAERTAKYSVFAGRNACGSKGVFRLSPAGSAKPECISVPGVASAPRLDCDHTRR